MANLLEDIQCVGSDTRPPMLDKTDFASWQQRIRLYCRGTEGSLHLGPERPQVYLDLSQDEKDRYNADIRATNIILQDNAFDEDVDEQPVQDLALNVDNVFQADDCDAYDSDVDEAPTAQTMFMANLSSADPVYDEAGPSYDSDVLSEVQDHDHYQDAICDHHEEHEMHDD
ncbi:hypothetical protein Tco_1433942, partial [Tanacetum coccineum]